MEPMKTLSLIYAAVSFALFGGFLSPEIVRADEGYSVEIKSVLLMEDGENLSSVTKATGLALDYHPDVTLPITLASRHTVTAKFDFKLADGVVSVRFEDLIVASSGDGGKLVRRALFDAHRNLVFGEEQIIYTKGDEIVSFVVSAPASRTKISPKGDLPADFMSKIEAEFKASPGRIWGNLYNPTEHSVSGFVVRVTAEPQGDFKGFDRRYKGNMDLRPMAEKSIQIEASLPELPTGAEYKFTLEQATAGR